MPAAILSEGLLAVTGATGWVGRTALHELHGLLGEDAFRRRVRAFATRAGELPGLAPGSAPIPVRPLPELPELPDLVAIFHTAFLTRDRIAAFGWSSYVEVNRSITTLIASTLECSPGARVVVISSGAAAAFDGVVASTADLARDPYGVLKREEERYLGECAPSLILRAYALTGHYMREPRRFALGDFLLSARAGQPIMIRAPMPVVRAYGHAGNIASFGWNWLLGGASAPLQAIDAVTLRIDLESLARRITALFRLPPPLSGVDPDATGQSYGADPAPFLNRLAVAGIESLSLDAQILDTASGLGVPLPSR